MTYEWHEMALSYYYRCGVTPLWRSDEENESQRNM